jgi:hypothetical protein
VSFPESKRGSGGAGTSLALLTFDVRAMQRHLSEDPNAPGDDLDGPLLRFTEEHYGELEADVSRAARWFFGDSAYVTITYGPGGSVIVEIAVAVLAGIAAYKTAVETLGWFYQHVSSVVRRFFGRFEAQAGVNSPIFVVVEGSFVPGPAVTRSHGGVVETLWSDPLLMYLMASHAVLLALVIAIVIAKAF